MLNKKKTVMRGAALHRKRGNKPIGNQHQVMLRIPVASYNAVKEEADLLGIQVGPYLKSILLEALREKEIL